MIDFCPRCQELGECVPRGSGGCPQTVRERQEAFRARNAMLGLSEVRGIYLPQAKHGELKRIATEMLCGE